MPSCETPVRPGEQKHQSQNAEPDCAHTAHGDPLLSVKRPGHHQKDRQQGQVYDRGQSGWSSCYAPEQQAVTTGVDEQGSGDDPAERAGAQVQSLCERDQIETRSGQQEAHGSEKNRRNGLGSHLHRQPCQAPDERHQGKRCDAAHAGHLRTGMQSSRGDFQTAVDGGSRRTD